jgi:hypothetical protein
MKTISKILAVAGIVTAFSLDFSLRAEDSVQQPAKPKNRIIAASPRAIEAFPWLAPERAAQSRASSFDAKTSSALAEVKKNRAIAASPRALEQFPELGRPIRPFEKSTFASEATTVLKNRAFAASPRAIETFPWLARGRSGQAGEKTFEVAPLK